LPNEETTAGNYHRAGHDQVNVLIAHNISSGDGSGLATGGVPLSGKELGFSVIEHDLYSIIVSIRSRQIRVAIVVKIGLCHTGGMPGTNRIGNRLKIMMRFKIDDLRYGSE
jgi:hypothetical protein